MSHLPNAAHASCFQSVLCTQVAVQDAGLGHEHLECGGGALLRHAVADAREEALRTLDDVIVAVTCRVACRGAGRGHGACACSCAP